MSLSDRLQHAWNSFREPNVQYPTLGAGNGSPQYKYVTHRFNSSMLSDAIYNRIAVDASMADIIHARKFNDDTPGYTIEDSELQRRFAIEANLDQSGRAFFHDAIYSMLDEGVIAIVPTDTTNRPSDTAAYDILAWRVGKIVQWYPKHVTVRLYDESDGTEKEVVLPKAQVAIVESPLNNLLNQNSGMLKRLIEKMRLLDDADAEEATRRLNVILQFPYTVRGEKRLEEANARITALNEQLKSSRYGVAYIDGTEKITQLNTQANNGLLDEVKYLTDQFMNQVGLTENVLNGTANEMEMRAYYNRTIDPILTALTEEFTRKFISKTAQTQGQYVTFRRDPLSMVDTSTLLANIDALSRNEITSSNEIRVPLGLAPRQEDKANALNNANMPTDPSTGLPVQAPDGSLTSPDQSGQNGVNN